MARGLRVGGEHGGRDCERDEHFLLSDDRLGVLFVTLLGVLPHTAISDPRDCGFFRVTVL